ncbi:MAG: hypothetical protein KDA17_05825 [Candidatus Saccharibacteria bacterium]|nr:hypothetical protein [Candidatus Saccharibacteria bacterium]
MKRNHDIITIECELIYQTEKAYKVDVGNGGVWVPKSLCEFDNGELQIPEGLASEKELI